MRIVVESDRPGEHVELTAASAATLARTIQRPVVLRHNGTTAEVFPTDTTEQAVARWRSDREAFQLARRAERRFSDAAD